MKTIAIMQPHLFPWFGYFEIVRNSDIFVFLDDIRFPHRSYVNRVKFCFENKIDWLSLPVERRNNQTITNTKLFEKEKNFELLKKKIFYSLKKNENFDIVENEINKIQIDKISTISEFNKITIKSISSFIFGKKINIVDYPQIKSEKIKSGKILEICKYFNATNYLTGLGGKNYLEFDLFEENNIKIEFLDYKLNKYSSINTNNLSILDILSYKGKDTKNYFCSKKIYWRDFLKRE